MRISAIVLCLLVAGSCTQNISIRSPLKVSPDNKAQSTRLLPAKDKVLLIIGQDLNSVNGYTDSGYFPEPGGITSYLAFYNLNSASFPAYGALGQSPDGEALTADVDWGAGPLNAYRAALDFPDSALVIGLNIAEGSGDDIWAVGGLADIGVGAYDENIRRLARFCKQLNKPIYLRIGYEFDGAWNRGYAKASSYIYAYRRIVEVMREQGVSNVAYVWQASGSPIDDVIEGRRENIRDWYPGDDYVDWMGLSWFLPADEVRQNAPSQRELTDEVINFARLKTKPVMIAEAAPQGYDLGEMTKANIGPLWDGKSGSDRQKTSQAVVWDEWFQPVFDYIHTNSDVIRAFAYINANWDVQALWSPPYRQGYWGDSRVQVNSDIRSRWLNEIGNTDFWLHGDEGLEKQLSR